MYTEVCRKRQKLSQRGFECPPLLRFYQVKGHVIHPSGLSLEHEPRERWLTLKLKITMKKGLTIEKLLKMRFRLTSCENFNDDPAHNVSAWPCNTTPSVGVLHILTLNFSLTLFSFYKQRWLETKSDCFMDFIGETKGFKFWNVKLGCLFCSFHRKITCNSVH